MKTDCTIYVEVDGYTSVNFEMDIDKAAVLVTLYEGKVDYISRFYKEDGSRGITICGAYEPVMDILNEAVFDPPSRVKRVFYLPTAHDGWGDSYVLFHMEEGRFLRLTEDDYFLLAHSADLAESGVVIEEAKGKLKRFLYQIPISRAGEKNLMEFVPLFF